MEDQKSIQQDSQDSDDAAYFKAKEPELQSYIGCKVIQAQKMSYEVFARMTNRWENGQETLGDGYMVKYDDGYKSWSPKDVFERCYRLITANEKSLIR